MNYAPAKFIPPSIKNDLVSVNSNYEYEIGEMIGRAIEFQVDFSHNISGFKWYQDELKNIAEDMASYARAFARAQDIDGSKNQGKFVRGNPEIYKSIRGIPDIYNHTVILKSVAKKPNQYWKINKTQGIEKKIRNVMSKNMTLQKEKYGDIEGGYYAGHVEYGHMLPDGKFYPARPFLRPAMRLVAEASLGNLSGTVAAVLSAKLSGFETLDSAGKLVDTPLGSAGLNTLRFGKPFKKWSDRAAGGRGKHMSLNHYSRLTDKKGNIGSKATNMINKKLGTKSGRETFGKTYSVRRNSSNGNNGDWFRYKGR